VLALAPFNRIGPLRRARPGMTLLDFDAYRPTDTGR
jgi:hypothetical protein